MTIPEALYRQIVRVMPVPCVDLLVTDSKQGVLLVKRSNSPAQGQWWFPGGRVHHGETRAAAAARKLREECGLEAESLLELGSYDVILDRPDGGPASHGVTTLFQVAVRPATLRLDGQSERGEWRSVRTWAREALHPFVRGALEDFEASAGRA
jgi:ADP-ribose pyrophosphatase YjhB (NUDIX family)